MHQLGMMEGMFGGASGRDSFSKIAEKLQPSIPAHEKIDALNELSQAFLMGTELTLRGFDAATFASLIVPCLDVAGGNAVVNSALLAIFNIMETLPQHTPAFVNGGCIRPVVAVLENVEFIDIADQAVSVLNKLAPQHSFDIASSNGLSAVLAYLDFFDAATQRSMASIASQLGKAVAASNLDSRAVFLPQFMHVLPVLTSMMSSSLTQLQGAGHQCVATLLMCITDATSRESLQSFTSAGAMSLLLHSLAAHFYLPSSSSEPRDRSSSAASPAAPADSSSTRRESLGATASGGSVRLSDPLVHTILSALQHVATIRDGQQLLLSNSIESLFVDFFLGHGFSQGALRHPLFTARSHSHPCRSVAAELHPQHHQPALSTPHAQHVQAFIIAAPTHRCEPPPNPPPRTTSLLRSPMFVSPDAVQAASSELLLPFIDASATDGDTKTILTSASRADVPSEHRRELLTLLPPLICSACAAGAASSNTRSSRTRFEAKHSRESRFCCCICESPSTHCPPDTSPHVSSASPWPAPSCCSLPAAPRRLSLPCSRSCSPALFLPWRPFSVTRRLPCVHSAPPRACSSSNAVRGRAPMYSPLSFHIDIL